MKKLCMYSLIITTFIVLLGCKSKPCFTCYGTGKIVCYKEELPPYEFVPFNKTLLRVSYARFWVTYHTEVIVRNLGGTFGTFIISVDFYRQNYGVHTEKDTLYVGPYSENSTIISYVERHVYYITKIEYRVRPLPIMRRNEVICPNCEGSGFEPNIITSISRRWKKLISKKSVLSSAKFEYAEVTTLTENFYNAIINSDINTLLSFYNYPLERYFSVQDASKEFVEKDVKNYFSQWSHRSATLISSDILEENSSTDKIKTKIVYKYKFINKAGKVFTGSSTTTLVWKKIENDWKIVSASEKVD